MIGLRGLIAVGSLLLLSACGFHLRDHYQLPDSLQQVAVQSTTSDRLADIIRQQLINAGAALNTDAKTRLKITGDRLERRTLSLFKSGQVAEYQLLYQIDYQILLPKHQPIAMHIEVARDYQDDPNYVLAKTREREILVEEMRVEAARRMVRQIIARLNDEL
ncbi:hypothetical protein CWI84_05180 [Idiomarina tyrosinivorans]|uniref:LPS-assembly lipoprotein LptE n=1 Tax=Idiomarina tyrosinivorans TaxID=1445662 RepID=A0A432ZRA6_9GAMM|nr:LPS assembly lipoprotein LptE [Idiomarina tyrosinivorans]RUO80455.1 hypothetical protein CWI84_05180 [Idiomarina tyrosinivorans]